MKFQFKTLHLLVLTSVLFAVLALLKWTGNTFPRVYIIWVIGSFGIGICGAGIWLISLFLQRFGPRDPEEASMHVRKCRSLAWVGGTMSCFLILALISLLFIQPPR